MSTDKPARPAPASTPELTPEQRAAAVTGGRELTARHADGSTEVVHVRLLPVRLLGKYQQLAVDEAASVELFCDRPQGWADTLAEESFIEILSVGEELNLDPLSRYLARQTARMQKLNPGYEEKLLERLAATLLGGATTLPPGSPTSPTAPA
ncbi:MAG: hypothetical protein D6781_00410 [Verrucomicrobia bacterium]|nr:MAG: hypothetical protein D6781_00410 [Verrucomicrobiota bacterium]